MERSSANITLRKDGRFMGRFIVGYDDKGKAQYQYVYGRTYDEAESKVLIGQEVASHYLSGSYITIGEEYAEWLNAVVNRVKESTLANYKAKFEKHILPEFGDVPCRPVRRTAKRVYKVSVKPSASTHRVSKGV